MNVSGYVRQQHGAVRVSTVVQAGISRHVISKALADGSVVRPRRGWLALPDLDPALMFAATAGATLTCVTAAARYGCWLEQDGIPHVTAPSHDLGELRDACVVHWSRPLVPRHPDSLIEPIENALERVAECRPFEQALAVWESAVSHGLIDPHVIRRLALRPQARAVLHATRRGADSGYESIVIARLRWMKVRMQRQVWVSGRRVDILAGERLVIQIDGGHHVGAQRASDNAHDARLMQLGYHVIRITPAQILGDWAGVHELIVGAIAQGLHHRA